MRRMLDPKTIGGGGDENLYCHCISFTNDNSNKGGRITLNYYSKKKDEFSYTTFKNDFGNRRVACHGYIRDDTNYFTAFYLVNSKNDIYVYYRDTIRNLFALQGVYYYTFKDYVSEVN